MSIDQLKKIRTQRVERVYSELQKSKSSYAQLELELQQAKIALEEYSAWRLQQQKSQFDRLQSDCFSPDEIKNYNSKMEQLKQKEVELKEGIPAFKAKLEAAKKLLDNAKEKLRGVNKDMEKVDAFIDMQAKEEKIIQERQDENVMDELNCFKSSQRS